MKKGGGRGKSRGQRGKVWCGCITESQEVEDERSYRTLQALFFLQQSYNELYEVLVTQ